VDAARYSAAEILRDGSRIEVRALKPTDSTDLQEAVGWMSDESIHRRFFALKRHFTEREIDFYLNVDFVNHVALVAVMNVKGRELLVGGGRYIVMQPGVAEVAFSIDDPHQGRGIGTLLVRHLALIAREAGLRELVAEVLPSNTPMLSVFKKAGLGMTTKREGDVVLVRLRLS
jgi:RimJ/RimL family protein N-acetyltransferase